MLSRTGYRLSFVTKLEDAYEAERGPARDRSICKYLLLSLAVNLFCLLSDAQTGRHVCTLAFLLRVGLFFPITSGAIFCLCKMRSPKVKGLAAILPLIVDTAIVVLLSRLVSQPFTDRYLLGAMVGIFAQTLIAPVPFWPAVLGVIASACVFCVLSLTPWASQWHTPVSPDLPIFVCVLGFSTLYERYRRERAERKDFLLSEANRLRVEEMKRVNDHLERLSSLDSLTGVFNRRYLDAALTRLWKVASAHERWIGVLMVDIDHFKAVNDTAGHRHGDFCLEHVAQTLQQTVRAGIDTVARYGGEEFVAILPDADQAETLDVGERVRASIEALGIQGAPGCVVTVSIGSAAMQGGTQAITLERFIETADRALYDAKHRGRNRLVYRLPEVETCLT